MLFHLEFTSELNLINIKKKNKNKEPIYDKHLNIINPFKRININTTSINKLTFIKK